MRISHWLTRLQNRPVRPTRRRTRQQSAESLEQRTLLTTVGVPISPTELTIFADDGDSVTVQRNSTTGDVEVLDAAMQPVAAIPTFQASTLTALNIFAGDADNTIDVSALTASEFPALTTIVIDSGDGDDVITGSDDFAELIDGDDGNDTITGNGGDDTIDAGDGNDLVTGGAGNDSILGGNGQDTIDGGADADNIDAGDGQDSVDGGDGDDVINAGDGLDTVNGGAGDDNINGMSGTDLLNGDADNDTILGGSENDTVNGGDGNDIVNGQAGNDTVSGDAGDDTAYGGGGRDSLLGNAGDDIVNGQSGDDSLLGGDGNDRVYGGRGNDSLDGGIGDDTLRGHGGNDSVFGGGGVDRLDGGSGNDLIDSLDLAAVTTLSISSVVVTEDDTNGSSRAQTQTAVFSVSLSEPTLDFVTVDYTTLDVSAVAGVDYESSSGNLEFAPGELEKMIIISVYGDTGAEQDESFVVNLSNPTNALIETAQGTGTIIDNDEISGATLRDSFQLDWDSGADETTWVVRIDDTTNQSELAVAAGATVTETELIASAFIVEFPDDVESFDPVATFNSISGVVGYYPMEERQYSTRAIPNDPLFVDQWHLRNTGQTGGTIGADSNVEPVWDNFLGTGVTIAIVDDGIQHTHPDLINNYDASLSFDYFADDADPISEAANGDFHGNAVAGVAAADGFNGIGVSGAAPDATLAGIRLVAGGFTDLQSANALNHLVQQIDVSNNSWGPADNGTLAAPGPLTQAALANGATTGRGGLGTVYVWAGGNGGDLSNDNVNYDGFANSRYTVAVGAIDDNGVRSIYSDPGAPLIVTAYSNDLMGVGITTTDLVGANGYNSVAGGADGDLQPDLDYTSTFGGTSSAAPLVSGVIALILEANPGLSYRDVTHVLVNSARMTDPTNPDWTTNSAGHDINHEYGFGAIDADAAVQTALTWTNVAAEVASSGGTTTVSAAIPDNDMVGVSSTVTIADDTIAEYVEVTFNATHSFRGQLEVVLTSPSGTRSVLADSRTSDPFSDYSNWTFTSARHWDEAAEGDWTLTVRDLSAGTTGTFDDWTLNVFGTANTTTPPTPPPPNPTPTDTEGDSITGGSGNDTIRGNSGDDTIDGGTGDDLISSNAGNDSIDGGDGNDTIDGGSGDDTIAGQSGNDVVTGGEGIDNIVWNGIGNGADTILASDGAETLTVQGDSGVNNYIVDSNSGLLRVTEGGASITVATSTTTINVNGGSENDVITITSLADVNPLVLNIDGQADNDTITAFDANIGDVRLFLNGGTGNDTITGSRDGDSISGDGGDDSVFGGLGNDSVDGGDGNDTLNGEAGNDFLLGNTGNDLMDGGDGDDIVTGGLGNDTAIGGLGNDSLFGGFGADVLNGNSGNDLADGGRDSDQVLGGSGNDSLKGGTGDDTIRGQSGSDLIKGGDGDDNIQGNAGNDIIDAGDGDDDVDTGNGNDIANGGDGDDTLNGMSGADTLLGGNGADNQLGGAGIDSLYGEEGDDSLNGGSSTDQFNGGEGTDVLVSPDAGEVDNNNLAIETSVMEALALLNGF